eukprot:2565170-Prymnesium_polylepis.1
MWSRTWWSRLCVASLCALRRPSSPCDAISAGVSARPTCFSRLPSSAMYSCLLYTSDAADDM